MKYQVLCNNCILLDYYLKHTIFYGSCQTLVGGSTSLCMFRTEVETSPCRPILTRYAISYGIRFK